MATEPAMSFVNRQSGRMKWFRHKPASSNKSEKDPPPYDDNPPSVPEKATPLDSVNMVASGPPIIARKKYNYWFDWSKQPTFYKNRNPALWGVWPYEPRLERDQCLLFRARAFRNQATALHPGEMEHVVHHDQDWTKHWAWAIVIRVHIDPYPPPTYCELRILVKDLPPRLLDKEICWKTTNWKSEYDILSRHKEISQKEDFYMRYLAFSTPEPLVEKPLHLRSWVAEVAVRHKDKEWLKDHDFRNALSPKNIEIAEIDQRTAPGRYKKVDMFRRRVLYGNDMTGQKVEAWKDEFTESFGAFIEPLLSWKPLRK